MGHRGDSKDKQEGEVRLMARTGQAQEKGKWEKRRGKREDVEGGS